MRFPVWHHARFFLVAALIVGVAACATLEQQKWYQQTRDATVKTTNTMTDVTTKAMQRMQGYLAKKDVLEKFRDSAEHSEGVVLDVLHKAGINRSASTQTPKTQTGKTQSAAKPPGGATPPAAGPKTPPAPASAVPSKYAGNFRWPLEAGILSSDYGERWARCTKAWTSPRIRVSPCTPRRAAK